MSQNGVLILPEGLAAKLSQLAGSRSQTVADYLESLIGGDATAATTAPLEPDKEVLTRDDIQRMVDSYSKWYHRFEFAPGIVTNSQQKTPQIFEALQKLGLPKNATGLRVLDIGCCDGFYSFEMEKRGAEVVPVDYRDVSTLGFGIAKRILGSELTPRVDTIYNITPERYGTFDVVLFLGVLYHLRHPILALDRMRAVMKPGAQVFIETHMIKDGDQKTPLSKFYRRDALGGNHTNYFGPNAAAVEAWLDAAEFKMTGWLEPTPGRGVFAAEAVDDPISANMRDLEYGIGRRMT